MKKYLTLSLLCLFTAFSTVQAQTRPADREQRVNSEVEKWRKALELTPDQTARLRPIMTEQEIQAEQDRARLEAAPVNDEERLQQEYARNMISYDSRYDELLEPWQRDRARSLDLYHEHRRFLRGLWIRWWWWPWSHRHGHHGWRHGHHAPPPTNIPPPPRRPPSPPPPPRPPRPHGPPHER